MQIYDEPAAEEEAPPAEPSRVPHTQPQVGSRQASVEWLNALAEVLELPADCTGITFAVDMNSGQYPILDVRRIVFHTPGER